MAITRVDFDAVHYLGDLIAGIRDAFNGIRLRGGTTPAIVAFGDDTAIDIALVPKGSGQVTNSGGSSVTGNFAVNTNKFTANATTGNTVAAGDAKSLTSTLSGRTTITQTGSVTTTVISDGSSGTITTLGQTAAAGIEVTFTVTCAAVAANDSVIANIGTYAGTGVPAVVVDRVAAGSFRVTITNLDGAAALNAALTINYAIIKSV